MLSASGHSFERLCVPHRAELVNYARRLTANGSQAEDLVQEAYVKALNAWPGFMPDRIDMPDQAAKAWLYRIVGNLFTNNARDSRLHRVMQRDQYPNIVTGLYGEVDSLPRSAEAEPGYPTPHVPGLKFTSRANLVTARGVLKEDSVSADVLIAINRLAPKRREAVKRYYLNGESCESIAATLGTTTGSVRSLLQRARLKLAPLLERFADDNYDLRSPGVSTQGKPVQCSQPKPHGIKRVMRYRDRFALDGGQAPPNHASTG